MHSTATPLSGSAARTRGPIVDVTAALAALPAPEPTAVDLAVERVRAAIAGLEQAMAQREVPERAFQSRDEADFSEVAACDPVAVAGLRAIEHVAAIVEARRHELLVAAAGDQPEALSNLISSQSQREVRIGDIRAVELAALLNITPTRARNLCHAARTLCAELPQVMSHLQRGIISGYHARLAIEGWQNLELRHANAGVAVPASAATRFQSRILLRAESRTIAEYKRTIASTVAALSPAGCDAAHAAAQQQRGVSLDPAPDGMAYLTAHLAAAQAARIWQALEHTARADTTLSGSLNQRMADALVSLCDGTSDVPAHTRTTAAEIQVLVSWDALTNGRPVGQIEGTDLLVEGNALTDLLGDAKFRRLLVDSRTGRLLDFGRTTYRPPAALRDHIEHRDRTCRAPGCTRSARFADIDHTIAWQDGGATDEGNLAALCRTHHVLKTHGSWQYQTLDDGTTVWQLPNGSTVLRPPGDYSDLAPPDDDPPF